MTPGNGICYTYECGHQFDSLVDKMPSDRVRCPICKAYLKVKYKLCKHCFSPFSLNIAIGRQDYCTEYCRQLADDIRRGRERLVELDPVDVILYAKFDINGFPL